MTTTAATAPSNIFDVTVSDNGKFAINHWTDRVEHFEGSAVDGCSRVREPFRSYQAAQSAAVGVAQHLYSPRGDVSTFILTEDNRESDLDCCYYYVVTAPTDAFDLDGE